MNNYVYYSCGINSLKLKNDLVVVCSAAPSQCLKVKQMVKMDFQNNWVNKLFRDN